MVADRDSSSRYCSESESDNEIENEAYVDRYNYQVTEPRIEIAKSEVIAERLLPTMIEYHPPPAPIVITDNGIDCSTISTTRVDLDPVSNSISLNEENGTNTVLSTSSSSRESHGDEEAKNDTVIESNVPIEHPMKRIAEMINRISSKVGSSSRTMVYGLPSSNSKISTKYNLHPAYMSLIYSLTPSEDINDDSTIHLRNKEDRAHSSTDDFIWFDELYHREQTDVPFKQISTGIVNDIPFDSETPSNEGSDVLELSNSTVLELSETDDREFENSISDKANEIIAELNDTCIVNEVSQQQFSMTASNLEYTVLRVEDDEWNSLPFTSSRRASNQGSSLTINDHSPEKKNNENSPPVRVINELIHHVVDECAEPRRNLRTEKEVKDDMNTELKGVERENCYKAYEEEDEKDDSPTVPFENSIGNEASAIFEFRTVGKKKRSIDDMRQAYELNFRVEKTRNLPSIIQIERSHEETVEVIKVARSEDYRERDVNSNNFSENETSLTKPCNTVISPEPLEICVECIHCLNTTSRDREYSSLSPVKEAENDPEAVRNLNGDGNEGSKQAEDKHNDTYTCSDSNESESDKGPSGSNRSLQDFPSFYLLP